MCEEVIIFEISEYKFCLHFSALLILFEHSAKRFKCSGARVVSKLCFFIPFEIAMLRSRRALLAICFCIPLFFWGAHML